ncbi:MAG: hypothetical protein H8F28_11920 [Fibrella sp.]|nr:hypothetical protein [Armatimonadota bacterium]
MRAAGVVAGIGALLLSASASRAQVLVTGFYNQVGADFFYSFEVSNTSGFDVTLVNVLFPTQEPALVITGESAPPEYLLSYDSGSLVFTGNAVAPFADGTTVGGFTLTSNLLLEPDSVEAFDVDNQRVTATFNSVDATTVPEASTLPLIALAASAFAGTVLVRRRNVARL